MKFSAEQLKIGTQEKIRVEMPSDLTLEYRQTIRIGSVLLLLPIGVLILAMVYVSTGVAGVLVMSAFSLVHVLLLLIMLGILSSFERTLVRLMCWGWWPLHRRWLLHRNPERLRFVVERHKVEHSQSISVDLDESSGVLRVGDNVLDLSDVCHIHVERSSEPEPRLRVLVGSSNQRPIVVCAPLPTPLPARFRRLYHTLPRMESDAVLLEWPVFCQFVRVLRHTSAASCSRWPQLLDWVCDERASLSVGQPSTARERCQVVKRQRMLR